jgi:F0F1-type ATP synthase assembly protein I
MIYCVQAGKSGEGKMDKWVFALRVVGIGWYIAFCILLGAIGGIGLDSKLGTKPIFALVGLLAGTFVAFFGLYRLFIPWIEGKSNLKKREDS